MPSYLIIGIDPGHTVGVAALDLSGHLLHVSHISGDRADLKATGFPAAVSLIESWGTPSLIATDVRPAPEMALKLASVFNVPLYVPARPWREDDKKEALRNLISHLQSPVRSSSIAQNTHERDALSAAIQAWRAQQNLLREADTREMPFELKERFKHLLLQGYRTDFALRKIDEENKTTETIVPTAPKVAPAPSAPSLSPQMLLLERQNAELRKHISFMEHEREGLLHRIRLLENGVRESLVRERLYRQMEAEIRRLKAHIASIYSRSAQKKKENRMVPKRPNASSPSAVHAASASKPPARSFHPASSPSASSASDEPATGLKVLDPYERLRQLLSEYRKSRPPPDGG